MQENERKTWWVRMRPWFMPLTVLGIMIGSLVAPTMAFAQSAPIPAVSYGTGNSALSTTVTSAMENVAQTIRLVLGGTALVVILAAAVMNHFVHDPRAKERAKELIGAAVVGLLLAAFAPQIVNFIASL